MSQVDIMEFFDKNIGIYFTGRQIKRRFKGQTYRQLKQIIKRDEYHCVVINKKGDKLTAMYGREE